MGMMGKHHARVLSTLNGIEFVGIVDPIEALNSKESNHQIPFFSNIGKLVENDLDYCVIAAPTGLHKEIALEILENDINCLIEKPVAINFDEAMVISEYANRNGLIVGVGHIERYNSAVRELKSRLNAFEIGEIYEITFIRKGPFPSRIADVGVIKDLATHDIDLAAWLTGSEFREVWAQVSYKSGRQHEDLVSINGLLANNVIVNISVNWLSPIKQREIVVLGEKGAFVVNLLSAELVLHTNGNFKVTQDAYLHFNGVTQGDVINFGFEKPEPLLLEHENFRDAILGLESEVVTLQEGIQVLRVADAVLKSSLERVKVSL
jgi:predicted dehydrogenase